MPRTKLPFQLFALVAFLSALLAVYSQLVAYWGDESLHLVAGQMIAAGKRPYLDFFYHHTPFFAYLVASLVVVFGESWRVVHLLSALLSGGALLVTGAYVYARANHQLSRFTISAIAVSLLGLNAYVISFGTVALPYALCLFVMAAAFVLITESVNSRSWWLTFAGGACAGTAAASYLLAAPATPVLLVWLLRFNKNGGRAGNCLSFLAGVMLPFAPLFWLTAQGRQKVWFDLIQYQLFFRAGRDLNIWFNLREIAGWFVSIQGLLLCGFSLVSLAFIASGSFESPLKDELTLSLWIAVTLCLLIFSARPVSSFYFVLITPFLAIPAAFGVAELRRRTRGTLGPFVIPVVLLVYGSGLSAERYIWSRETSYADYKTVRAIAQIVDEVTPPAGMIYAFEAVYFEGRRLPPPGLENRFNPNSRADEWLQEGRFDTVCISSSNPRIAQFQLLNRYHQRRTVNLNGFDFYVLWDKAPIGNPQNSLTR